MLKSPWGPIHEPSMCKAPPAAAPVRKTAGIEIGDRHADAGGGGRELVLGLADVRPALEQRRRHPGRHLRQRELLHQRKAARHLLGRAADQHADRVLRLLDLALGLHHRLGGLRHEDLRLADVDHAGDTAGLAHLHDLQVLLACLERALGDLQLVVERAEVEVRGRHVGHQGAEDEAPRVHRGQQVGARRFGGSPETAPEIDLERQVEAGDRAELILGLEERALTLDIRVVDAARVVELGKLERSRDGHLRARLEDSRGGHVQVVILEERFLDQLVQDLVLEEPPPGQVPQRQLGVTRGLATEAVRSGNRRSAVVGADGAGAQAERQDGQPDPRASRLP